MSAPSPNIPVLSVSQLTQAIKLNLEHSFPSVWLQGEISNCKLQSSGHLYFCLKDNFAQISAIMFKTDLAAIKLNLKDGAQVIVRGEINVYPPSGKYQIIVREMRMVGVGELLLRLEELKAKLKERGWFHANRKKPLPKFPKRIGVVTSPTGAVIQDILNILSRRFSSFHLILNPVRVQGEGAAYEIAQAIRQFNQFNLVDVMIVGRGGGSLEDLWAFNEEIVAEAIFSSHIPVISAVGHETDHCIADYVADVRAPTPSAAAEIVMAEKAQHLLHLEQSRRRLLQAIGHLIRQDRRRLEGLLKQPVIQSPYVILSPLLQRLDEHTDRINEAVQNKLTFLKQRLDSFRKQLIALQPSAQLRHIRHKLQSWEKTINGLFQIRLSNMRKLIEIKRQRIDHAGRMHFERHRRLFDANLKNKQLLQSWNRLVAQRKERLTATIRALEAVDPRNLLTKGYCIAFAEKDDSIITSIKAVENQQDIRLLFSDGELLSKVKEIKPRD